MRFPGSCATDLLRGAGLALGSFAAINELAEWLHPGFDANLWWIDFPLLPAAIADLLLILFAAALLSWSLSPQMKQWRRVTTLIILTILLAIAVGNVFTYYGLLWRGTISSTLPIPFSIPIAAQLLASMYRVARPAPSPAASRPIRYSSMAIGCLAWGLAFPMAQFYLYGKTDYRRPADAILVFGARVYANGEPSLAVADRVRTGCALYHEGYAPLLIMSGGPGDGQVHETQAMQQLAMELGIPSNAILRDTAGLNTQASVRSAQSLAHPLSLRRVLAVSQYWHLPRIKLAAGRGELRLLTVPAIETRPLRHLPYQLTREIAAFWAYYASLITSTR